MPFTLPTIFAAALSALSAAAPPAAPPAALEVTSGTGAGDAPAARQAAEKPPAGSEVPARSSEAPAAPGADATSTERVPATVHPNPQPVAAVSRPVLEQRVYLRVLETFALSDAERAPIDEARQNYLDRQEAVRVEIAARIRELTESRKSAPSTEPPSPAFRKAMEELRAKQPRISELQRQVDAILGAERAAELKQAFEDELLRARRELAERAEAERKAREARQRAAAGAPAEKRPAAPEAPE